MPTNLMLAPLVKSLPQCVHAIEKADLIILGPGSFLTSVIPPLLVRDISKALCHRKGKCVFIENVVEEKSPASALSIDQKLQWIEENIGCQPIDAVICQDKHIESTLADVICMPLSDENTPHYHDRKKLIAALDYYVNTTMFDNNIIENIEINSALNPTKQKAS